MQNKGFTLLEVLVAALIIMLGVTGYVRLQSLYIKNDASSNQRSVAMQLAQEKADDLRSFTALQPEPGEFSFADIADNEGGQLAPGEVEVRLTNDEQRLYRFDRNWQVRPQYFVDTDADGNPDSWLDSGAPGLPAVLPPWPAQKQVLITVSWKDQQGESQSVSLQTTIAPVSQAASYQATGESDNTRTSPAVSYTPEQAPEMMTYEPGENQKIQTSKPVPVVKRPGNNTQIKFQAVKYSQLPGQEARLEQEDFLTLECQCQVTGTGMGATPHMTVLIDDKLGVQPGSRVTKTTGAPATVRQPALCIQCCRDHHDSADMALNETYYRLEDGLPHRHYLHDGNGNFSLATGVGEQYHEVCRFKRVDGLYQLYPDWQLLDIIGFEEKYLLAEGKKEAYTSYSESLVSRYIQGLAAPARPDDRSISVAPGVYQMVARGIYLERMTTAHQQKVAEKIINADEGWKGITPFYDVNLTLLASWSTQNPQVATITRQDIQSLVDPDNDYYSTYSRGRLATLVQGLTGVSVASYPFNAGLTGGVAVSPTEYQAVRTDTTVVVTVK